MNSPRYSRIRVRTLEMRHTGSRLCARSLPLAGASQKFSSQPRVETPLRTHVSVRSAAWSWATRGGVHHQTGPRPANRRADGRRHRIRPHLRRQEVRGHDRPARVEGAAGLRPPRGRDRRAHLGPARPDRARHPQPHPPATRARRRRAQPRRPDPRRLRQPRRSDGATRRGVAGAVRADGTHLHPGTGRPRAGGGHRQRPPRRPPLSGHRIAARARPYSYAPTGAPSPRSPPPPG
jgi:hypothetical protein